MTQIWGLADKEFKTSVINMLRALMEKTTCKNRRMMETKRKNQKEMLNTNKRCKSYKERLPWAHQRLHTARESSSEREHRSADTLQT